MDSKPSLNIPNINFSRANLQPESSSWRSVRTQVIEALQKYGCFEAVYDEVDAKLQKMIAGALEELFDVPSETKMKNSLFKPYDGYSRINSCLYEGMGITDAQILERLEQFANLMWETGNANFCDIVHSFVNRASELEQMVRRMVFEGFNVEKYYDSNVESRSYFLRFNKYKSPIMNETGRGMPNHSDMNFLTIIHQNDVNGLEVQIKDGRWIKFMPSMSSFVVVVGDAFMAWSNGRLHSPLHHVMMNGDAEGKTRYSIALFSFVKGIIVTPKELVDEDHPLLFKPFDIMGLYRFYRSKEGREAPSAIKAYCGI